MIKFEKIIKYGLYLAFVLPFAFTSRTMQPWHFGKVVLFQILVEILLALALVFLSTKKIPSPRRFNLLDWLVVIFLALQFISAIFGVNFNRSFWGDQQRAQGFFTWLHFGVFYFLLRAFFVTKKDWLSLGLWILIVSFASSILAWLGQYFSLGGGIVNSGGRFSGIIGNPIFFAAYLIIPAFLGLAMFFLLGRERKLRWIPLGIGVLNFLTILATQIRGAFVGLMVGVFFVWLGIGIFSRGKVRKFAVSIGIGVLILLAGVYVYNQKSTYIQNNLPNLAHVLDINLKTTTADTRLMAWKIALESWRQKPVFGWGIENFQDAFDLNYDPGFLSYSFSETVWDKPHNFPLEVLSTMGAVGLAGYLSLVFVLFYFIIKIIKNEEDRNKRIAFILILGAGVAYLSQNLFGIETGNSLQIWFGFLAFISSYYAFASTDKNSNISGIFKKALGWLAVIFIILTPYLIYRNYAFLKSSVAMGDTRDAANIESLYLWQRNAPKVLAAEVPFMWEQAVFLTQDLNNLDAKGILDKATLESVNEPLREAYGYYLNRYPESYLYKFWGGQFYEMLGEYVDQKYFSDANRLLEEAWNINKERQTAGIVLAKNYLVQGKTKEGIKWLEEVAEKNPDLEEPHWFLGLALIQDGQRERGLEEIKKGEGFGISGTSGNIIYLINLYAEEKNYNKIVSLYEVLIDREPNNPQYYVSLAVACAELGNNEMVIENINKAVELQPQLESQAQQFLRDKGIINE